jgi:transcriptional regulator with XRE-family HTH domain
LAKSLRSPEHLALLAVLIGTRHAVGLDQRQVAERMGWSQAKYSKTETGIRRLDLPEFRRLAKAFGVDDVELYSEWSRHSMKMVPHVSGKQAKKGRRR